MTNQKPYTRNEVFNSTLKYFNNDELAANVWINKYCLKDSDGNLFEKNPTDMHHRLAKEFARIESKYENPLSENQIFELLDKFKHIIPAGSPMAGIGNDSQITSIANCFVVGNQDDSYGGIFQLDQEQAQLMKRRGGVGMDISHIRPKGSKVNNSALISTGIVPFMERFSNTTREVAQDGRRGALMLTISVHHPDIEDFLNAKLELDKVTGANISVRVTDEFMNAVKTNTEYEQRFPVDSNTPIKTNNVKAKKIWDILINNNWKSAEPGVLFWDTIIDNSTPDNYAEFKTTSTNPCFAPETLVSVKQQYKTFELPIKELTERFKTGEQFEILSFKNDIGNYKYEYKPLLAAMLTKKDAALININTTVGTTLQVTPDHEIFIMVNKSKRNKIIKVQAKDLKEGNILITDCDDVRVDTIRYELKKKDVYDITVDDNHNLFANGLLSANCGEINLSNNDSCRLLAINLYNYVDNQFKDDAKFNFDKFKTDVGIAQRLMDDITDLEIEKIDKILEKIQTDIETEETKTTEINLWNKIKTSATNGRRTGLGTVGLGDTIAALNVRFATDEANEIIEKIFKTKAIAEYTESVLLAKERGTFPVYDVNLEKNDKFMNFLFSLDSNLKELHTKYGRRNISISTNAPTGSQALMTQTSSGIEPAFMITYKRRKKINPNEQYIAPDFTDKNGDSWTEHNVFHHKFIEYCKIKFNIDLDDINKLSDNKIKELIEQSPYYKATASDLDYIKSVEMQGIIQKYISHSISKTSNLPASVSVKDVSDLYMKAWEVGCKGFTIYRDGSRDGVLISNETESKQEHHSNLTIRPKELNCDIHHLQVAGDKYYVIVGLQNDKPTEIFVLSKKYISIPQLRKEGKLIKIKSGVYNLKYNGTIIEDIAQHFEAPLEDDVTRLLSLLLKSNIPMVKTIEQIDKAQTIPSSFSKAISRAFKKFYINDDDYDLKGEKCPECGGMIQITDGCKSCPDCGWSKCS